MPSHALGVFQHIHEALVIVDRQARILAINPAFSRLTGFSSEALIGKSLDFFLVTPRQTLSETITAPSKAFGTHEVAYRSRQGRILPGLLSISCVEDTSYVHEVSHYILMLSSPACLSQQANRGVYFDPLTGLPNHHLLPQLVSESIRHAQRSGASLTVATLDIDHFKLLNDQIGQAAADSVLKHISERLNHQLQGDEVLARTSGDEFVLLLQRKADDGFLNRLLDKLRQPLEIEGQRLQVTGSLGVAFYTGDESGSDVLLRHANQAMYRAKQHGRNTFHRFDLQHEREQQHRQTQQQRIADAISQEELRLYYQPQIDMANGKVIGMEALVRWQHPDDGLLAPGAFLPLIEGSHLEVALGEWVITQALTQLQTWQREGLALPIHVNISPNHLLTPGFVDQLAHLLRRYPDVSAHLLKLEILETAAMHDVQAALGAISHCQALGIDVAIDDFGTGFSSLTHLRQLPVNLIKIDQSFVRDMLTDPDDTAIVESVVYMARRFGRPLLAEGVETLDHARALLCLGCRLAQGYGIARPMPAEQLPAWLNQWPSQAGWHRLTRSRIDDSH
ncbi:MAG: EAL domain-containing protein [Halomonas sp.]|nr:EAL domain-containing protein [Halomonas sp.]